MKSHCYRLKYDLPAQENIDYLVYDANVRFDRLTPNDLSAAMQLVKQVTYTLPTPYYELYESENDPTVFTKQDISNECGNWAL